MSTTAESLAPLTKPKRSPVGPSADAERTASTPKRVLPTILAVGAVAALLAVAFAAGSNPDPTVQSGGSARLVDIAVLVFREGLESILVLAAVTASLVGGTQQYRRPITGGAVIAGIATLVTWVVAVRIVDSLTESIPALHVQAATGLLAILVLVVVMNWFFHKVYWTGWIGLHTRKRQRLIADASSATVSARRVVLGLALLGFTSVYREGFEVVLFLQSYRLRLGGAMVLAGVSAGLALTAAVAVLTFVAHRRLPYRRMLVLTGTMLGVVLLVMVGEQAQEMQLAGWLATTPIPSLERVLPAWMGLWFAVFPTAQTLAAQGVAAVVVLGSYWAVRIRLAFANR